MSKSSKKSPPPTIDPSVTGAWVSLMRAQHIVLSAIEEDLDRAGMPPLAWYDVLLELSRAEGGQLRPYEIEERILLAQYNLSRLLDRLEREGLVQKQAFGDDKRGRWIKITEKGTKLRKEMWSEYSKAIHKHVGVKIAGADAAQLSTLLQSLISSKAAGTT